MLGADLGSALVVQILSFNLSWLIPIFLIAGGIGVFKGKTPGAKQTGRVLVGIALILISLAMLGEATQPLQYNTFVPLAVDYLKADPVTAFLIGGIFTWLIHSHRCPAAHYCLPGAGNNPIRCGRSSGPRSKCRRSLNSSDPYKGG